VAYTLRDSLLAPNSTAAPVDHGACGHRQISTSMLHPISVDLWSACVRICLWAHFTAAPQALKLSLELALQCLSTMSPAFLDLACLADKLQASLEGN